MIAPTGHSSGLEACTAVILVGGFGTRLRSIVFDRPKPMAEVHGRPFVTFLLDQLVAVGMTDVVLCTGYRGDQVVGNLGARYKSVTLRYSHEVQTLGTAGALRQALPFLNSETVLAFNGDSFCNADLNAFFAWHVRKTAVLSLVLAWTDNVARFGQVSVDETARVTQFTEKNASVGPGLINAGIYLLSRKVIDQLPANQTLSLEKEIFPSFIQSGLYGYPTNGSFIDIGTPDSYAAADAFFKTLGLE